MDRLTAQELANFRYRLISPIVSRNDLKVGETKALIEEAAAKEYCIPGSEKTKISTRSIERYLKAYREGGWEALMPAVREGKSRIPKEYIDQAILLKKENPSRSIVQIITMLEEASKVPEGVLKRSTVYDHFKKHNLTGRFNIKDHKAYQRYGAKKRNQKWQGDTCQILYIPDPENEEKKKKVYLIAWLDDYSRVITHAQCYFNEKLPMLEDSLKKAIMKYALPENIYVDNAKIYCSEHLERICGKLGVNIIHSRPYRPQGRGKVERLFSTIKKSFASEIYLMQEEKNLTLSEVNDYLSIWIKQHYHKKVHSSTKKRPVSMFENDTTPLRNVDLGKLHDAFLLEENRKVSKAGLISLNNIKYQADLGLVGRDVLIRYDPYNLEQIQVFCEGERFNDATLFTTPENINYKALENEEQKEEETPFSGLNFLSLLKEKDNKEGIAYKTITTERQGD